MNDGPFPPLPGLTFEASVPGTTAFARYRDANGGARTVERRPEAFPSEPDLVPANELTGIVARVAAIHTVGAERFLVYEVDAAAALTARIHDRAWGSNERLAALDAIARGLASLHARGLVHGDLTPDALLLLADGSVRFAALTPLAPPSEAMTASPSDARTFGPTLNRIRATGGALAYLAPEQFMAHTTLAESDVFAWGCVAYEVATGRSPYGFLTDPAKLLDAIARGPQRAIHELSPSYAPEFDSAVRGALTLDRKLRALPESVPARWRLDASDAGADASAAAAAATPTSAARMPVAALVMLVVAAAVAYVALVR
jgi:hypothetical protein